MRRLKSTLGRDHLLLISMNMETQERMKQQRTIEKESLPPNVSYRLVRSYLLHYGYEEILNAFDVAGKSTIPPIFIIQEDGSDEQDILYALNHRKTLRQIGNLEEAVQYGRIELAKFFEFPEFIDLVQDCVALLAYEQPHKSSVGYLLQESQREIVADTVNAMILSTYPNVKEISCCLRSPLERLLGQLTVCCLERRSLNGDQGEAFHLHSLLS